VKRLAVFLDGTWNDPGDNTNVWRLRSMLSRVDDHGVEQLAYYDTGVGTRWYDRVRGGAAGVGLSKNIREAYRWLVENYDDGDEIYIFGFSRGAFTARSLAGMISKCGLLMPGSPMPVPQVFERYQREDARPIYRLPSSVDADTDLPLEDRWIVEYSRRVRIKLIGVWDTVGTLGVNVIPTRHAARGEYDRHFVRLSKSYDHAYQAIALDEHRKPYPISRWYRFIPEAAPDKTHEAPPEVEQRWFIGAHSNVGGGYRNDPLSQIPLGWLQRKAAAVGLQFRYPLKLTGTEHRGDVVDSFAQFMKGVYRIIRFGRRFYREVGLDRIDVSKGWIVPHYETIDASVFRKWADDADYRPKNIAEWADRLGIDPATITTTQDAVPIPPTSPSTGPTS
jgi:uncharacterized protein (DUF2235 family)